MEDNLEKRKSFSRRLLRFGGRVGAWGLAIFVALILVIAVVAPLPGSNYRHEPTSITERAAHAWPNTMHFLKVLVLGSLLYATAPSGEERQVSAEERAVSEQERAAMAARAAEEAREREEILRRHREAEQRRRELLFPPFEQQLFVGVVTNAVHQFQGVGNNEFAQGATRPARRNAICEFARLGQNLQVQDWVGTVERRTTNNEGRGVLYIRLSEHVVLKTWNNAFSDLQDRTLVDPNSSVFQAMSRLPEGTHVRFSGRFIRSATDCVREASVTLRGSMTAPEFIFRFEALRAAL